MANIMQMMQKASQMKAAMQDMQVRVKQMELSGTAGGGAVSCTLTGGFELRSLKIDPSVVNPQDVSMLEDLIIVAVNDARRKAEQALSEETRKIMADAGLPAGLDLPF